MTSRTCARIRLSTHTHAHTHNSAHSAVTVAVMAAAGVTDGTGVADALLVVALVVSVDADGLLPCCNSPSQSFYVDPINHAHTQHDNTCTCPRNLNELRTSRRASISFSLPTVLSERHIANDAHNARVCAQHCLHRRTLEFLGELQGRVAAAAT
jgi:hypothetical protein